MIHQLALRIRLRMAIMNMLKKIVATVEPRAPRAHATSVGPLYAPAPPPPTPPGQKITILCHAGPLQRAPVLPPKCRVPASAVQA
jgi:hypothetical protein